MERATLSPSVEELDGTVLTRQHPNCTGRDRPCPNGRLRGEEDLAEPTFQATSSIYSNPFGVGWEIQRPDFDDAPLVACFRTYEGRDEALQVSQQRRDEELQVSQKGRDEEVHLNQEFVKSEGTVIILSNEDTEVPVDLSKNPQDPLSLDGYGKVPPDVESDNRNIIDVSSDGEATIDLISDPKASDTDGGSQEDPPPQDESRGRKTRGHLLSPKCTHSLGLEKKKRRMVLKKWKKSYDRQQRKREQLHRVDPIHPQSEGKKVTSLNHDSRTGRKVAGMACDPVCRRGTMSTPTVARNEGESAIESVGRSGNTSKGMDVHCRPRVSASGAGGVQEGEATERRLTALFSGGGGRANLHGKLEQTGTTISGECRHSAASREAYLASLLTERELALQEERPASRLAQDYSRTGDDRQDRVANPTVRDGGHSNDAPSWRRHRRDDPPPAGVWDGGSCCNAVCGGTKATTSSAARVVQPTTRVPEGLRSASRYDAPRHNAPAVPSCSGLLTAPCRKSSSAGVNKLGRTRGEASHRRAVATYPTSAPLGWHSQDNPQWKHCCSTPEPREELQVDFLFDLSLLVDWQDAIPLVAIDVMSGVHIVIPVALARCNPIPWDVLLGEDKSSNLHEPCGRQSRVVHCRLTRLSSPPPIRCSEVAEKRVRPPLLQAADGQSQAKCCRFSSATADYGGRPARRRRSSSSSSRSSSCERLGQRATSQAQETHTLDTSSSSGTYGPSSSSTSRTVGVGSRSLSSSDEGTITRSSGTKRERLSATSLAAYPAVDRRRRTAFWVQETNLLNEERGTGPVSCAVCRRVLRDVEEVVRHHQRRHRGLAKCPLCPARLHPSATSVHLRRHYLARVTNS